MIYIIILLIICSPLYGGFAPWKADVLTGDKLTGHRSARGGTNMPVYNAVQGGAFFLIRFFQIVISPQDGPNCRHEPVCSVYGAGAVVRHGAFAGSLLAADRVLRCNPFYPPSKDPVPERIFEK